MFKEDFKYYKSKKPPPDLCNVLDFNSIDKIQDKIRKLDCVNPTTPKAFGLKPPKEWNAYSILSNPGLIFIRNPFTSAGQRYWIVKCLRDYTKKPNKLNLDVHEVIPSDKDWWDVCQTDSKLIDKLRWATLGYHHNWNTKIYNQSEKDGFPSDLKLLSSYTGGVLGFKDFNAEAAIVNYYHMDSTLSGHTDHSEQFLEAPLFSFSFGQSAIFLLGGQTLDTKPTAMFLHSGDIVVMSKESRLCYHGVPKIVKSPEESWCDEDIKIAFWKPFNDYLKRSRININVRQVLEHE